MNIYWSYIRYEHLIVGSATHRLANGRLREVPVYAATFEPRGVKYRGLGCKDLARQAKARAAA